MTLTAVLAFPGMTRSPSVKSLGEVIDVVSLGPAALWHFVIRRVVGIRQWAVVFARFYRLTPSRVAPHGTVVMRPVQEAAVWADGRVVWEEPSGVRGSGTGAVRAETSSGR